MGKENVMIDCGTALTVANAAALHQKLQTALNQSSTITLKADDVEKVDTAGLQLCVALNKEVAKLSGQILWHQPSQALAQAAKTLGLTQHIGLHS